MQVWPSKTILSCYHSLLYGFASKVSGKYLHQGNTESAGQAVFSLSWGNCSVWQGKMSYLASKKKVSWKQELPEIKVKCW